MKPVFDKPEWTIRQDQHRRSVAGMDNKVLVCDGALASRSVCIIIPTEFFQWARDVLKKDNLEDMNFYLDVEDDRYYFGVDENTTDSLMPVIDLWYYTKSNLPYCFQ